MKIPHGFIILGIMIIVAFLFIIYNEPSTSGLTDLMTCAFDNSKCTPEQSATVNNVFLFILAVGAVWIARIKGVI